MALLASSWPVVSLATVSEFESHPERVLLRHADALGLSPADRALLRSRMGGMEPEQRFEPVRTAPGFDRRLAALAADLFASSPAAGAAPGGEAAQLMQQLRADRDALEAEWARLDALWNTPKTKPVRDRLREQRRSFGESFARLERLAARPAAGASGDEDPDRAWLRSMLRRPARTDPTAPLPFTRLGVGAPIQPATSSGEIDARLAAPGPIQGSTAPDEVTFSATTPLPATADAPPGPGDLAETIEVQFTPDIQALAASLNNRAVEIFNWVHDNITYAVISGSIQGADHCLQVRSCSDVDIASLLISLLRTSGIPARYQMGTVDIPEDQAKNWVGGADTLQVAGDVMATGGIPGVIFNNDRLRIERVWVRAFVDMNPSRGAIQIAGDTWVDMDAAFKQYENTDQLDISASVPTDLTVMSDVAATATTDPVTGSITSMDLSLFSTAYSNQITATADYFMQTAPETPLLAVTGSDAILPLNSRLLAGTPPYDVVTAGTPFDEVTASQRHTLTIRLEDEFGGTQFSVSRTLAELAGSKLAISYDPATPADQAALEALFASVTTLAEVPATISSSINFRANLKFDDVTVATGTSAGYGSDQTLHLDFAGPLGARSIPGNLITGAYYAIGLDLEQVSPKLRDQISAEAAAVQAADADPGLQMGLTQDGTIGTLLQSGILNWFSERDLRDHRLAKGARVINQRLPSSGLYFNSLAVDTLFGQPVSATVVGATLDIGNDFGYVLAKNGSQSEAVTIALAQGQTGSEMEASIQEVTFSTATDAVVGTSTMRILQQANNQNIPIYRITNANSSTILPLLSFPASDISLVTSALAQGREVVIPETQVLFAGNPITGLITEDPATGSAAYLISGGLGVYSGGLAEFTSGTTFAIIVAIFFAIVGILALLAVISAGVALFAAIMSIVIGIVGFFIGWADIVDNQPDRGLTIGEAAAGIGIIALFALGLYLGIVGLFAAATLGGILFGLAIGIISILLGAFLKDIIVGLLDEIFQFAEEILYAWRAPTSRPEVPGARARGYGGVGLLWTDGIGLPHAAFR